MSIFGSFRSMANLSFVLTERTCHVIGVVAGSVLLAHDRDMMVGSVHGGPHQVRGAGVDPDIFLVDVFLMNGRRHQAAIGAHHEAAHLGIDRHIAHAGRNQNLLIYPADTLADGADVVGLLIGSVRNAHAAGKG